MTTAITEIIYTFPNGKEEVRYRRAKNSQEALEFVAEIEKLKQKHGKDCPYDYRHVQILSN